MKHMVWMVVWALAARAENWPGWRGPDGGGVSRESGIPVTWSKTEGVRWRVELPEPGNSTPAVWGDAVLITQAKKAAGERLLLCLDRATGKQRWRAVVPYREEEPTHATNPYALASPATDGERAVAWFGSAGLHAFDLKTGKPLWKRDLGRQRHTWGYASSPLIAAGRVFLNFGPGDRNFLVAVDVKTGQTAWQVDIPVGKGAAFANWAAEDMYGSWSTPLLVRDGNRELLVVSHPRQLAAYDLASGKRLWAAEGLGDMVYPSAVLAATESGEPVLVAASGFQGPVIAVKLDGTRLWRWEKNKSYIGSAVSMGGYLYWVDNGGIAQAVRAATGEVAWTARLPRAGEDNGVWSSPVLNQGRIYVMNKSGATHVFRADPKAFESLGTSALDEPSNSSVVISGGMLFLRTHQALWAIAAR